MMPRVDRMLVVTGDVEVDDARSLYKIFDGSYYSKFD